MSSPLTENEMCELKAALPTTSTDWSIVVDKIKSRRTDENGDPQYPCDWYKRILCDPATFSFPSSFIVE